MQEIQLVCDN